MTLVFLSVYAIKAKNIREATFVKMRRETMQLNADSVTPHHLLDELGALW